MTMKYWIKTLIALPFRRGDKYEWSMFRNPDLGKSSFGGEGYLIGPEPKLAEGYSTGASR